MKREAATRALQLQSRVFHGQRYTGSCSAHKVEDGGGSGFGLCALNPARLHPSLISLQPDSTTMAPSQSRDHSPHDIFASATAAMFAETPPATPHRGSKRHRSEDDSSSDEDDEVPLAAHTSPNPTPPVQSIASGATSENVIAFARRHGIRRGLRGEQLSDLTAFAAVRPPIPWLNISLISADIFCRVT